MGKTKKIRVLAAKPGLDGHDRGVKLGGGIIPDEDIPPLKEAGIAEIFGPGTVTTDIISYIEAHTPNH
ncbi:MAG: hypothetical protein B6240_13675 [Desulfobacteraceae bacterium 4572_87]|nr:MAG: hypothetical protein B6240_13675 [Desulfobacteraceae bacterium 4572_87]